jgi:hypothetical protein
MTHSPLCRWHGSTEFETVVGCDECDLIAKVREDALAAAVQRVEAIADDPNSGVDWNWDYDADPTGMTRNPLVWIREAVAAIKNEGQ